MMKKLLILIALCSALATQAQITLEHTYPNRSTQTANTSDSTFVYHYTDSVNLYIYSSNHTLIKTVPHGETTLPTIPYVSQYMFDSDPGYEFIMWTITTVIQFKVMNDDGTVVLSGTGTAAPRNTPDGTKLIAASSTDTKVYDLPGPYYTSRIVEAGLGTANPYPNPSADWVKLPYELTSGTGTLTIIDMAGRVQKSYGISGMYHDIRVEPGTLPAGQYLYYIEAKGQRSEAKPFIIQ